MATLGHWNKQGLMSEEYLFWDNAALMKQIGLGQWHLRLGCRDAQKISAPSPAPAGESTAGSSAWNRSARMYISAGRPCRLSGRALPLAKRLGLSVAPTKN